MSARFVHLHLHSEYSLVDSTIRIPELVERCAALQQPAVAITDQNNLFALVKFYKAAESAGIKPIIGADILLAEGNEPATRLTLLCRDRSGYLTLSRLLTRAWMEGHRSEGVVGFMKAIQSEPQRAALDRLLVLGTLLEGHADHVMDAVGPAVVPSVTTIRRRFDERRHRKQPPLQRLLRALLGIDAKLSQYTRGKAFVEHVVGRVGMDRFNTIWTSAETLPLPDEIDDPQRWIDRIL